MSDFWTSDLGEVTGSTEDAFAKSLKFVHIPSGTTALAKIESFTNEEERGYKLLVINWLLIDGDFKDAVVRQKLKVLDPDPEDKDPARTRHRGLNMLKLIYNMFHVKPKHSGPPADHDLDVFVGKTAGIKIRETNDQKYNYISEVHEANGFKCETGTGLVVRPKKDPAKYISPVDSAFSRDREFDQDIPF
jgi:hypothetical protein